MNESEAASYLCLAVQTLRNWRFNQKGPAYLKISSSVRYRLRDLEEFIKNKRIDPENN